MEKIPNRMETSTSYQAICQLATGGMGSVHLAVRKEGAFQRLYAVKRLKPDYREDESFRAMFLDEARIAGYIRHPNVVSVLDVGEDEDGPFTVMDYVDGVPLQRLIVRAGEETLPLQVCLRIGIQIAKGLHAAHEVKDTSGKALHIVHRDVSPQNILVGFDGVAKVTDFGIAKALGRYTKTSTGVLKGKFGYMSPELLTFDEPDRRSDLFALGIVLFEMLTGRRLYRNVDGMDGARRIVKEAPPDLGDERDDAPPALVQLMFSLLAKLPDHRPDSAKEVSLRLEEVLQETLALEDRTDLDDFMSEAFPEDRRETQALISQALRDHTRTFATGAIGGEIQPAKGSSNMRWVAAGAGLIALLVVGAWIAIAGQNPPEAALENSTEGVIQTAPPQVAEALVTPDPQPTETAPTVEEAQAPDDEVVDTEPESRPPTRPRASTSRPNRVVMMTVTPMETAEATGPAMETMAGGVPMWGWQE